MKVFQERYNAWICLWNKDVLMVAFSPYFKTFCVMNEYLMLFNVIPNYNRHLSKGNHALSLVTERNSYGLATTDSLTP